jgi:hypothetical protein
VSLRAPTGAGPSPRSAGSSPAAAAPAPLPRALLGKLRVRGLRLGEAQGAASWGLGAAEGRRAHAQGHFRSRRTNEVLQWLAGERVVWSLRRPRRRTARGPPPPRAASANAATTTTSTAVAKPRGYCWGCHRSPSTPRGFGQAGLCLPVSSLPSPISQVPS